MAVMRMVGNGHKLPPHARVHEQPAEYVIELDVSDFTEAELAVEALGPLVAVRGDQLETKEDEGVPFRLHERLEETFRLPDDAIVDELKAFHKHGVLELRVPRRRLTPRRLPIEHRSLVFNPDAEAC